MTPTTDQLPVSIGVGDQLRRLTFRRQISLAVALGVVVMALMSSIVSAWQGHRQIAETLSQQGMKVATSLAAQSQLALLSASAENAKNAIDAALAFPDVSWVELSTPDGKTLVSRGQAGVDAPAVPLTKPYPHEAYLERETENAWQFLAPVWFKNNATPFEIAESSEIFVGYVRVMVDKGTLHGMTRRVFFANLLISICCAAVFLMLIRWLAVVLTRPLRDLADVMSQAERGETDIRAKEEGPKDLASMAQAFNKMLSALDERTKELHRHQEHLEETVKERTAELVVARDKAEQASRAKSTFLARMSHELRTPLNAIMGYAQLLRMGDLSQRQKDGLGTIYSSGEHLLLLINDVLDLASIEAGRLSIYPLSVDTRLFFKGIEDIMSVKAHEKRLSFRMDVATEVPDALIMDEKRVRQVLLNLLSNAVRFTDVGEVVASVTLADVSGQGFRLRFEVRDTGEGIDPADLQRIFEPFEQAAVARHRGEGSGLGLAISRQLVRMMGGNIQVESQPGQGSLFWFDLWLGVTTDFKVSSDLKSELQVVGYKGSRRKVLVVDDVLVNRELLRDTLTPLGFDVSMAVDGLDGLSQIRAHSPDLVLMDVVMPVMDGLTAVGMMRKDANLKSIPVLVLSANASMADRDRALAVGANGFLSKPLERSQLLQHVAQLLDLQWTTA